MKSDYISSVAILALCDTVSDNVHFMNTAQMVKALTEAEVQFRFQVRLW